MNGTNTGVFQYDNNYLSLRAMQEQVQIDFITKMYGLYKQDPVGTIAFANILLDAIQSGGSNDRCFFIEKGTNSNQYSVYSYAYNSLNYAYTGAYTSGSTIFVNIAYLKGTFFLRGINHDNTFNGSPTTFNDKAVPYPFLRVFVPEWKEMFVDFGLITTDYQDEVLQKLDTLINQSQQSDNEIANKIEEGNQLQQEQNDFLKQEQSDEDVSVDSFNSVESNDVTSEGLNGIFTTIYNTITQWNSKSIVLPIPHTDKSITINPNYTNFALTNYAGGTWIKTFIETIYYFIVARFIIYSITNIINSIKSGSILETDSKNNITTDML